MGALTCTELQTELARRVTQVATGGGSAAEAAINRAIRWVNRQGSYTFQLSDPTTLSVTATTGLATIPADMDTGKAHVIYNPNGTQIERMGVQDVADNFNFNTSSTLGWNSYIITQLKLVFYPAATGQPGTVSIIYHKTTTNITGSGTSNLPKDFDDLIVDLAEAEERRIYDVGEIWPQMLARSQEQIVKLLDGYRSTTQEGMLTTEAVEAVQQRTSLGRA